jgi:hypothetical protein
LKFCATRTSSSSRPMVLNPGGHVATGRLSNYRRNRPLDIRSGKVLPKNLIPKIPKKAKV